MKDLVSNTTYEIIVYSNSPSHKHIFLEPKRLAKDLEKIYTSAPSIFSDYLPNKKIVLSKLKRVNFDKELYSHIYSVLYATTKNSKVKEDVQAAFLHWLNTIAQKLRKGWTKKVIEEGKYPSSDYRFMLMGGRDDELFSSAPVITPFRLYFRSTIDFAISLLEEASPSYLLAIKAAIYEFDDLNIPVDSLPSNEDYVDNVASFNQEWYQTVSEFINDNPFYSHINFVSHLFKDKSMLSAQMVMDMVSKKDMLDSDEQYELGLRLAGINPDGFSGDTCFTVALISAIRMYDVSGIDIGSVALQNPFSRKKIDRFIKEALVLYNVPLVFPSMQSKLDYATKVFSYILFQHYLEDRMNLVEKVYRPSKQRLDNAQYIKELSKENDNLRNEIKILKDKIKSSEEPFRNKIKTYENEIRELNKKIEKLEEENAPIIISRDEIILEEDISSDISTEEKHNMVLSYIKRANILIWGARSNEEIKLKERYPELTFISSDTSLTNAQLRKYDACIMYVGYTNHSQYYKAKDMLKNNGIPFKTIEKGFNNFMYLEEAIYSLGQFETDITVSSSSKIQFETNTTYYAHFIRVDNGDEIKEELKARGFQWNKKAKKWEKGFAQFREMSEEAWRLIEEFPDIELLVKSE